MRIWNSETEFDLHASSVAMGMFDGVHVGHQRLILHARKLADRLGTACVVSTFDRHPFSVLCPDREPMQLISLDAKLEKFEKLGVDGVLLKPFTAEYAATEPEVYLRMLVRELNIKALVAGFNYTFGNRGYGNAAMIREMANELGYTAEILNSVMDGQDVVSSTLIRSLMQGGEQERAAQLLQISMEDTENG